MDLKSGYPYWAVKNGLMHAFPPLQGDLRCDVAIVGGGISGALIADELARHGHDVAVIERRDVAWGSSSASTGLLQYEIDTHLTDLARRCGEDQAVRAYRGCADAVLQLGQLAKELRDVGFARKKSLYLASRRRDCGDLRREFELRRHHGFDVALLDAGALRDQYGIDAPLGIVSRPAAIVDPYRLTYRLLQRLQRRGGAVHDRSIVESMQPGTRGVELHTSEGHRIRARHVVIAAGYATQQWLRQRVARNRSSYAFVTDPIDTAALGPLKGTMLWETARPYLYVRPTVDGRLIAGGEDDPVDIPARRDARVQRKARRLHTRLQRMFPHLPLTPAFSWGGTFAETDDGLPFFGAHPQHGPRVLFAMAYGGNGITYSMIGARLLRAHIERGRHPLGALFSFDRLR